MIRNHTKFALLPLALLLCTYVSAYGFPVTPECDLQIDPDRYIVEFQMPNYTIETDEDDGIGEGEEDDCGLYDMIVVDANWDGLDIPGYPQLPFMSLHLILPDDAESVNVTFLPNETTFDNPSYPIIPAKKGSFYDTETELLVSMDEECENSEYYVYGATSEYPDGFFRNFYTISDIYMLHGSKGVTLSIFPFAYYPHWNEIEVLLSGTFEIEFDGGDVHRKIQAQRDDNTVLTMATQLFFDSFDDEYLPDDPPYRGDYVIVASHTYMADALQPYVDYKSCQGYDVEVVYLDEMGGIGNPEEIKNLIHSTSFGEPDFVLLIGSIDDIPPYSGEDSMSDPYSDDGYYDYIGRWVVPTYRITALYHLVNIIDKTIETERQYAGMATKVALFSGVDDSCARSRWFYNDMKRIGDKVLNPLNITYTLCDGRLSTSNFYRMKTIMESDNQHLFVYSGHGSYSGIGNPFSAGGDVLSINTTAPFPMGFGFACSLGSYGYDGNAFAMQWVRSEYGGVTFYGASVTTMDCPDRYLSRHVFDTYRKIRESYANYPISIWLRNAEQSYYRSSPGPIRSHQVMKYNLIGDPTLHMRGLNMGCSQYISRKHSIVKDGSEPLTLRTDIIDIAGNTIFSIRGDIDTYSLNVRLNAYEGVFIIKRYNINGNVEMEKIIM